ncbi:MAG: MBL fold metallo-hydrolase RNA specificity domain-containing protein [Blautia sp.]|nr:MBL fold metallo-hydrolase [Blautia sp.]MDD7371215.1 MBL fold metallo-hydrolase [Bacillota bacterium]
MKLTFIGATHEVTGSCYFLEAAGKKFLVDCGMEQGPDQYENQEIPVALSDVDFALLTHAHIDHSGNFPLAYAKGFRGPIYATAATCDLCDIMLRDSAHIQMFEAEWRNRKGKRNGQPEFVPAYTMEDALGVIRLFVECDYNKVIELAEGIRVRFVDAGHLLGSSSIELWVTEDGVEKKVVFSGDIGNLEQPLIKDPEYIDTADYVVMESTYGDRSHGERPDYVQELVEILRRTFRRNGNVVVPSFAVGRTQEMLYFLRKIKADNLLPEYPDFEVYVDSPLAVQATNIFKDHYVECYDEEAMELLDQGINPIAFPGLKLSITSDESRAINMDDHYKVILSASGMCDAGRIKHHLKHNLWRPESTIVFVGYQAVGTLGRALLEGAPEVRLFGEDIKVYAEIVRMSGISGHADNEGLMRWASSFKEKPAHVFVTHGEDQVCEVFAERLRQELGYEVLTPFSGTIFDLAANVIEKETQGVAIHRVREKAKARKASGVYARLIAAGQRLMTVIRHNEGGTNKDLARFADQINSLCDKWDR